MIKTILVPVDGSSHADAAVDWASDLASKYQAKLVILHVIGEGQFAAYSNDLRDLASVEKGVAEAIETAATQIARLAEQRARSRGAKNIEAVVEGGNPAKVILARAASTGAQLIVMGRRGLGGLPGLVLGSVSSKVLHLAGCACLTVK